MVKIERFRHVMIKPSLATEFLIGQRSARRKRNRSYLRPQRLSFAREIQPIAVPKPEITEKNVGWHTHKQPQSFSVAARHNRMMAGVLEQGRKHPARIFMILNEQNVHAL